MMLHCPGPFQRSRTAWSLLHVSSATIVANALENVCETTKMYSMEHMFVLFLLFLSIHITQW